MGNAASANGKNNDELIDHLVSSQSICTKRVEQAMRYILINAIDLLKLI